MRERLKAACRTNSAQMNAVSTFTILNIAALVIPPVETRIEVWIGAILIWPFIAFVVNLISPQSDK